MALRPLLFPLSPRYCSAGTITATGLPWRFAFEVFSMKRNRYNSRPAWMPKIPMRTGTVIHEKARAV